MIDVAVLWAELRRLEQQRRFEGNPYPNGMCPFPFRLTGQGFFPGGDGLWRDPGSVALPSAGKIETHGVVFLGNDFGTLRQYEKYRVRGYEDPWTWKNVKRRVMEADIPVSSTFFTNAVIGLRSEGTALQERHWSRDKAFFDLCGDFLHFQLSELKPNLLVVLGPKAREAFDALGKHQFKAEVLYAPHPYPDHMNAAQQQTSVKKLREVYTALRQGSETR